MNTTNNDACREAFEQWLLAKTGVRELPSDVTILPGWEPWRNAWQAALASVQQSAKPIGYVLECADMTYSVIREKGHYPAENERAVYFSTPSVEALQKEVERLKRERDMFENSVTHWKQAYREDTEALRDSKECALAQLHEVVKAGKNLSFMAQTTGGGPDAKLIEAIDTFAKTLELGSVAEAHRQFEGQRDRIATLEATNAAQAEQLALLENSGRVNRADETGGTVKRFGFDCTVAPPDILPATNGAYVHYHDYAKLYRQLSTLAESQLVGGEAVGEVVLESMGVPGSDAQVVRFHMYKEIPPVGTKLYTAAPAIKQQVAESAESVARRIVDVVMFDLDGRKGVLDGVDSEVRDEMAEELSDLIVEVLAPTHPVFANQPDGGKVPRNDDVDQLLHAVFQVCEATEEIEPKNEFERGRRFEAKHIRNGIGNWFQDTFCGRKFMGEPVLPKRPSAPIAEGDK